MAGVKQRKLPEHRAQGDRELRQRTSFPSVLLQPKERHTDRASQGAGDGGETSTVPADDIRRVPPLH